MWKNEDQLLYGSHGICTVLGTQLCDVDRKQVEYYVLQPVAQPEARYYVPTQNQKATAKMSALLTPDQIDALLRSEKTTDSLWIPDDNHRKCAYRELLSAGDRVQLMQMLYALRDKKRELERVGKRFHQCDESFIKEAQKLLGAEISHVLHIPLAELECYIQGICPVK